MTLTISKIIGPVRRTENWLATLAVHGTILLEPTQTIPKDTAVFRSGTTTSTSEALVLDRSYAKYLSGRILITGPIIGEIATGFCTTGSATAYYTKAEILFYKNTTLIGSKTLNVNQSTTSTTIQVVRLGFVVDITPSVFETGDTFKVQIKLYGYTSDAAVAAKIGLYENGTDNASFLIFDERSW